MSLKTAETVGAEGVRGVDPAGLCYLKNGDAWLGTSGYNLSLRGVYPVLWGVYDEAI